MYILINLIFVTLLPLFAEICEVRKPFIHFTNMKQM